MKLKELIKKLQELEKKHGEKEVMAYAWGGYAKIKDVDITPSEGDKRTKIIVLGE